MLATGALTTAVLAAGAAEPSPLKPHTAEIIVGLVAFVLLFLFLRAKVFPVFEKAYADRAAAIEGGIKRAEEAQAEANAALEQYKAQLAEARAEAARIRDEAREQGKQIVDELTAEARETAARIMARGEEQLAAERQQVVTQLRGEIGRLAVELAERVVGESLADEDRQRRVVDRFLAELEQGEPSGTAS
ncbi:MAG: synthase subunit [Frankiales bacterium]|nr:synthase subunit [Frankiales bacterium]